MTQTNPPGSHAELCAKRRKNQTIKGLCRDRPGSDADFDKLAWNRLFSVTGDAHSQHTTAGEACGDKR
jgi:hypothetical protein